MSATEPSPPKELNESSSHYALHVALQTMRRRNQVMQKRLSCAEDENLALRMSSASIRAENSDKTETNQSETQVLREKVSELTRQKVQLMDHISMVASENRQLWSRLSKISKDNRTLSDSFGEVKDNLNATTTNSANQNLIRSKTFTKSAPNPMLREKLNKDIDDGEDNLDLEDISLINKCGFLDISDKHNESSNLELGYLHNEDDSESNLDAKKCTDSLIEIQKELLRQQVSLKSSINKIQIRKEICKSCRNKKTEAKPQTADKSLSTDNDFLDNAVDPLTSNEEIELVEIMDKVDNQHIDFIQDKIKADALDKMCPMCGKIYVKNVGFYEFQEHVESHFIDVDELEMSLDRNFEYISKTVGNF